MRAFFAVLIAFLSLLANPAAAQERIESFHGRAEVREDGSIEVTETIRVMVLGQQIRRGIMRDIPTRFQSDTGQNVKAGFDFVGAEYDGRPVETKLSRLNGGVRIRLGDPDVLVPHGSHVYRIRYTLKRAVGFYDDFEQMSYNVTGNGWGFTIDRASTTIILPEGGTFDNVEAFTGRYGSTANDARIVRQEGNEVRVETTRPLAPREGLTVRVTIPHGVLTPPSAGEQLERRLADWAPAVGAVFGLLLVAGYYLWTYVNVGRDPKPGTIVPLFAPPDDLSPAAIRYVTKQRMDDVGFAAAMVEAGVKGHIRLEEVDKGFFSKETTRIRRLESEGRPLDTAEARMLSRLLDPGETIEAKNENHEDFSAARKKLDSHYSKKFEGKAFKRNIGWAIAGMLVLLASIGLVGAGIIWSDDFVSPILPLFTVASLLITMLLVLAIPEKGTPGRKLFIGLAFVGSIIAGFLSVGTLPFALQSESVPVLIGVVAVGFVLVLWGFTWMSAPTQEGRALLDRIAGFKQYLSTTEGNRFDRMQPAGEDLKLFERFLPYAIALGVENEWADKFADRLKAAELAPDSGNTNHFLWYSGSRSPWDNPGGFSKAVGSSFASTLGTASAAPSSGGGSGGGGGFSGGGVGGGGGGGW